MKNKKLWAIAGVLSLALVVGLYSSGTIFQGSIRTGLIDKDGDGIRGSADLCPLKDATGYDLNSDGCIDDTDGDTVKDNVDVCPTEDATGHDADGDGCIDASAPLGTITVATSDDPVLDGEAIAGADSEDDPLLVARYKVYATGEPFRVSDIQFENDSDDTNPLEDDDAINTVILKYPTSMDAPTVLDGRASTVLIAGKASFTDLDMAVPESMSGDENAIDVEVYVTTNEITTGGAFSSGAQIEMDFDASDEFHAIGLTSGTSVTETSSYFGTTADVDANEITLIAASSSAAGTITVTTPDDPVLDGVAIAGDDSSDAPLLVARYKVYATGENFTVTKMQFENDSDDSNSYEDDDAISTVILKYPTSLEAPTVLDGTAAAILVAGKASFTGLDMAVPESMSSDENAIEVEVYVTTNSLTSTAAFSTGAQIEMDFDESDEFEAIGLTSGATVTESSSYFGTTRDIDANEIALYKALPSFAIDDSATSPCTGTLTESSSTNVYCFSVTATGGAVSLYSLTFNAAPYLLNTTGTGSSSLSLAALSGWHITEYDSSGVVGSTLGSGTWFSSNFAIIYFTSEEIIAEGTTSYYVVKAPVYFSDSDERSSLSVSRPEDTTYKTSASGSPTSYPYVSGYTVWSDRSATGHSTTTADWTNGYKLSGLPTTTLISRE